MQSSRGFEYGVIHLLSEEDGFLCDVVAKKLNLPVDEVFKLLNFGAVYFSGQRITNNIQLKKQDYVRIHTKPRRFTRTVNWTEHIVWQDSDYLVLNKPAGLPCHPTVDNLFENILFQLSEFLGQKIYLTHRLDLPTSGLIVFAKSLEAQTQFNKALSDSSVIKIYEALVEGSIAPPLGTHIHYMEISPRAPKVVHSDFREKTVLCNLKILETKPAGENTWVRIKLETGRTHQIRAQLSKLGFPIVGDTLYGAKTKKNLTWDEIELKAAQIIWPPFEWGLSRS